MPMHFISNKNMTDMAVTITIHLRTYNFTFLQDSSQESCSESTNGMLLATDIATYVRAVFTM